MYRRVDVSAVVLTQDQAVEEKVPFAGREVLQGDENRLGTKRSNRLAILTGALRSAWAMSPCRNVGIA